MVDGKIDALMDGWQIDGLTYVDGQMDGLMEVDGYMDGLMDRWMMDGVTNGWTNG